MPTQAELEKLTVVKLKDKLRDLRLDDKGRKAELIQRLLEAQDEGESIETEKSTRSSTRVKKAKKVESESESEEDDMEEEKEAIDYSKLTVPKLRALCKQRDLDESGRKQQLIDRLEGSDAGDVEMEEEEEDEAVEEAVSAEVAQTKKRTRAQQKESNSPKKRSTRGKAKKIESESESEESSSEEEPPAKRPCSPKNIGKATVDKFCQLAGTGAEVYEDYDCMLNQTNVANNNNKFYVIQVIKCGGTYYHYNRWGRVGEPGRNSCKAARSADHAIAEFLKKFKAKTGNIWGEPFAPKPRLYTQIEMSYEDTEEMAEKLATLDDGETPTKIITKPSVLDSPTQNFISLIFNENMFKEQMVQFDLDVKKMPLGQLSKSQINAGYSVLEKIKKELDKGANRSKLESLTNEFYTKIPHSFGRRRPPILDNAELVMKKMEMLAVLGDIEIAVSLDKKAEKKTKDKKGATQIERPNPLDKHYESLHCDLTYVDNESDEFKLVQTYALNTSSAYRKSHIKSLWRVEREGSSERFSQHESIGNRKLLWHGTNIAVVAAILNSGLRIMPHSGGRVGRGIYFASENGKSSAYVSCSGKTGVMFLGEAVLGKEHHIDTDDPSLRAAPTGYDSIVAKGRVEPNPVDDVTVEFDGHEVVVPTGRPIAQPKWSHSRFQNSEYLVYKESQAQLRYVMTVEFTH